MSYPRTSPWDGPTEPCLRPLHDPSESINCGLNSPIDLVLRLGNAILKLLAHQLDLITHGLVGANYPSFTFALFPRLLCLIHNFGHLWLLFLLSRRQRRFV